MPAEPAHKDVLKGGERTASPDSSPRLRPDAAGWAWAALLGLTALFHLGSLYLAKDLPAHLHAQLGLWLLSGLGWLLALLVLRWTTPLSPGSRAERRTLIWLWAVALLMRGPALALPVEHSDDVYRYLWDGAVQQAGHSPYAGPPDDPEYARVRARQPELSARINHRELPTIYPPAAQLVFRVQAQLSAGRRDLGSLVRRWKGLVVAADLLVFALLLTLCRGEGRDLRWAAVWGAAPLPAIELALNGHLESLGVLPLLLALRIWQRAGWMFPVGRERETKSLRSLFRAAAIGALTALAVLVKPVAGAILPAALRLPRRARLAILGGALLAGLVAVLPYAPGGAVPPSLGEYGRRWRSNDGAYALLQGAAQVAVDTFYRPPYYEPWHRPALARALTGRQRDTVWPDELAGALARGCVLLALVALAAFGVRRRLPPIQLGLSLLLGYQLLTPTLHPWYELWPLSLCAL